MKNVYNAPIPHQLYETICTLLLHPQPWWDLLCWCLFPACRVNSSSPLAIWALVEMPERGTHACKAGKTGMLEAEVLEPLSFYPNSTLQDQGHKRKPLYPESISPWPLRGLNGHWGPPWQACAGYLQLTLNAPMNAPINEARQGKQCWQAWLLPFPHNACCVWSG